MDNSINVISEMLIGAEVEELEESVIIEGIYRLKRKYDVMIECRDDGYGIRVCDYDDYHIFEDGKIDLEVTADEMENIIHDICQRLAERYEAKHG